MSDRVVALGQRSDDRRLVGEILVERTKGDPGPLDDVAHPEGFAAFFRHHLDCAAENALEALAAALLDGNQPRFLTVRGFRLVLPRFPPRHRTPQKCLDLSNTRVYRF